LAMQDQIASFLGISQSKIQVEIVRNKKPSASLLSQDRFDGEGDVKVNIKVLAEVEKAAQVTDAFGGTRVSDFDASVVTAMKSIPQFGSYTDGQQLQLAPPTVEQVVPAPRNSGGECFQVAETCVPGFDYKGHYVQGCTKSDYHEHWCSQHKEFKGAFGLCSPTPCEDCWQPVGQCVNSFTYEPDGKTYNGCTKVHAEQYWCSEDPKFKVGSSTWSLCVPCSSEETVVLSHPETCWEPHPDCVDRFQYYTGDEYVGCTTEHSTFAWCSKKDNLDEGDAAWTKCKLCEGSHVLAPSASPMTTANVCYSPASECVGQFEFVSTGTLVSGCTTLDSTQHWCSKNQRYEDSTGEWDVCSQVPCSTCFIRDSTCKTKFKYQGKEYTGCTEDVHTGGWWCSLEDEFVEGKGRWATCQPCEASNPEAASSKSSKLCYKPAHSCVSQFTFNNSMIAGCTLEDSNKHWCSHTSVFEANSGQYDFCTQVNCEDCFLRAAKCSAEFQYEGKDIQGCTAEDGERPWCSEDRRYKEGTSLWHYCMPCQGATQTVAHIEEECYQPAAGCVSEFSYKGLLYGGCTQKDHESHWCSRDRNFDAHGRFLKCSRVACNTCYLKEESCKPTFAYGGQNYNGCTLAGGSEMPWCSLDDIYTDASGNWAECAY